MSKMVRNQEALAVSDANEAKSPVVLVRRTVLDSIPVGRGASIGETVDRYLHENPGAVQLLTLAFPEEVE